MINENIISAANELYFTYGINIEKRKIFLVGDISEDSSMYVNLALHRMNEIDREEPIEFYVSSVGGEEDEANAIFDTMRMIKAPVYTIALGKCYSAAPLLVAGGEPGHRYSGANTNFMVHQSWDDFGVKRSDEMEKYSEAMKKAADRWYKLMEKLTKKPYSFWKQKVEEVGDTYFSANQAKTWGVIDHIWDEKAN